MADMLPSPARKAGTEASDIDSVMIAPGSCWLGTEGGRLPSVAGKALPNGGENLVGEVGRSRCRGAGDHQGADESRKHLDSIGPRSSTRRSLPATDAGEKALDPCREGGLGLRVGSRDIARQRCYGAAQSRVGAVLLREIDRSPISRRHRGEVI
jgi:hypothetical protein